ncbi:ABC transporter substrate-binding protein [Dictyobacter kobayashii]|uniref:Solute-binding protein family 3/N-terminal domain-containing protein n=1 Tax=Dictyobacter kobayashii TaxID=2014872 RepID=A0A402AGM3_9CHLR|nr:ABC transporter substrate-binding protein [Dictyobacter kobayashii]GCE18203.1 hypothetical protein KDK_20030 [Dictyobacter kobayashii]
MLPVTLLFKQRLSFALLLSLSALTLLLAACGGATGTSSSTDTTPVKASVAAPKDLISGGNFTVGTDPTYFPMEYIDQKSNSYAGFDIDLSDQLARHMGLKLNIQKTSFDTIFNDLDNKRFDIVNASVYISDERKAKYDFVPYMQAGSALLVANGNPKGVKGVDGLCDLTVGVQSGTSQLKDLGARDAACKAAGKPEIKQIVLKSATDVIQLLANHRADVVYLGSLSAAYYNKINPGQFALAGPTIDAGPSGLVIRKGDSEMLNAVQKALQAMKADGSYNQLFAKYGFPDDEKIA